MKKMYAPLLILLLFGCKCEDERYSIYLVNQSTHNLNIYVGMGRGGTVYPDTTLPNMDYTFKVSSEEKYYFDEIIPWKETYRKFPKDTMSIFYLHTDTIAKYPWGEIRAGYNILKRYDLSLADLQKLNYTVTYPPTAEMKDMKMYPPYPSH